MCKGSTNTTTSTTSPNPSAMAAYQDVVSRAQSAASTPYQPYTGEQVAGLNSGQQAAIGQLQSAYGLANPYINTGASYLNNAASGLSATQPYFQAGSQAGSTGLGYLGQGAGAVANGQRYEGAAAGLANPNANAAYMNPYTSSVIDATMAQAQQNDAIQSQQLASGAIGAGAFGGDRAGVAQAALAGQQALANNQTIAGLNQANYQQATAARQADAGIYGNLANSANQSASVYGNLGSTANSIGGLYGSLGSAQGQVASNFGTLGGLSGNLGLQAQNAAIQSASAGLQASTLQQQNQQQQDTAAYNQYVQGLSYPFTTTQFLSNIVNGAAGGLGSSTATTAPAPSTLSQIAGAGTAGLGILGATGAFGSSGYLTGANGLFSSMFSDGGRVGYKRGGLVPTMDMAKGDDGVYRKHFLDGGDVGLVDPNAPVGGAPSAAIPSGGLNFASSALTAPSAGLVGVSNNAPMPIVRANPTQQMAPQPQGLGVVSAAPSVPSAGLAGGTPASSGLGGNNQQNLWTSVMAAGLGMMGGTSPFAAVNIGQGAMAGLNQYQQLQSADRQNALAQSEIDTRKSQTKIDQQRADQAAEQLRQQAEYQHGQLAIASGNLANSTASTQSEIQQRGAQTAASLQTMTPAGILQRDPANPTAPPKLIPWSAMSTPAGGAPQGSSRATVALDGAGNAGSGTPAAGGNAPSSGTGSPSSSTVPQLPAQMPIDPRNFSPVGQDIVKNETNEALKDARTGYTASQNTMLSLDQMQHDLAQLPKSGFLAAGPGQQQRAAIASQVRTAMNSFGISTDTINQLDPNAIASSEALKKLTNRMGFDLAKSLGGREPGFIVQQAVGSVPSSDNTPMGAQRLIAGLRATAQRQSDYYQFLQNWTSSSGGSIKGADEYFNQQNPPQMYANRAIVSTVDPRDVQALQDNAKNPAAASAIDKKYGTGVSKIILGQ